MSHSVHVSCTPFPNQFTWRVADDLHVFKLDLLKYICHLLHKCVDYCLNHCFLVFLFKIFTHRSCAQIDVHIVLSIFLAMYIQMKEGCRCLQGSEGLNYSIWLLLFVHVNPTLSLDKPVQSLVKWRVFELCSHQIVGVKCEFIKLLILIPEH